MKRVLAIALLTACGVSLDEKETEDQDTAAGQDTNSQTENLSDCPDEVPDTYRYVWDCQSANCGGAMVYRYGEGLTEDNGDLSVSEKWFIFEPGGNYMVDTFEIQGQFTDINESTFGLSGYEEKYEIWWTISEQQSNWDWKSSFADQENDNEAYYGYLLLDTYNVLSQERHPDNAVMLVGVPVNIGDNEYSLLNPYAVGTASPVGEDGDIDNPFVATDFVWASDGACYQ